MAHVYDTKAQIPAAAGSGVTALTCIASITCGGSATLLVLALGVGVDTARTGASPMYNSVTMTDSGLGSISSVGEGQTELWYLSNPSTGAAYNVEVPNSGRLNLRLIVSSYAAQSGYTSVLDVVTSKVGASTNPTASITTTVNGDVIVGTCFDGDPAAPTARSHTSLYENDDGAYVRVAQYFLQATAGATTLSWDIATDDWALILAAFKEQLITVGGQSATVIIKSYHWAQMN